MARDLMQIRRGNKANLPTLAQGEMGVTLDTLELFIGGLSGNIELGKQFKNLDGSKQYEIVAGVMRQNATDKTKWDYLLPPNHNKIGVSGDYAVANGTSIVINFEKSYSKPIAFITCADETLAKDYNMTVGASVGTNYAELNAGGSRSTYGEIYYDDVAMIWKLNELSLPLIKTPSNITFNNGTLQVVLGDGMPTQSYGLSMTGYGRGGSIAPLMPILKAKDFDKFTVTFSKDFTTYQIPVVKEMSFTYDLQYNGGLYLDGTRGLDFSAGNIWFFGIFEV